MRHFIIFKKENFIYSAVSAAVDSVSEVTSSETVSSSAPSFFTFTFTLAITLE